MGMLPALPWRYGIGKYAFELDLAAAHEMFGLNYIIFRPHNVYGPNQNIWDRSSAALQPCTHNHARAAHVFEAHGAADDEGEVLDSVWEVGADVEHLVARGGVQRCNRDRLQRATLNEQHATAPLATGQHAELQEAA